MLMAVKAVKVTNTASHIC